MLKYNNEVKILNCLDCKHGKITTDNLHVICGIRRYTDKWTIGAMIKEFRIMYECNKNIKGCKYFEHDKIQ